MEQPLWGTASNAEESLKDTTIGAKQYKFWVLSFQRIIMIAVNWEKLLIQQLTASISKAKIKWKSNSIPKKAQH